MEYQQGLINQPGRVSRSKQKTGVRIDQFRWQQPFMNDLPLAIQILKQACQQTTALLQSLLKNIPFLSTDHPGQAVQLPGAHMPGIIIIGGKGDAVLVQQTLHFLAAGSQNIRPQRGELGEQMIPVCAWQTIITHQLVVGSAVNRPGNICRRAFNATTFRIITQQGS